MRVEKERGQRGVWGGTTVRQDGRPPVPSCFHPCRSVFFFLFPETPADEELAVKSPLRQESSTVAETF